MDNLDMLFPDKFIKHLEEKYELISSLGSGAMGYVIKAKDLSLDREVAIKILHQSSKPNIAIQRFENEAKLIAKLDHPNIVTIYDYNEFNNIKYIVEKYLSNGNLEEKLNKQKKVSIDQAIKIAKDVLKALNYAHEIGIIHRDIKPANILFTKENIAVITDFGIAKFNQWSSKFTNPGEYVGTPEFLSPEQALGKNITNQSDLYSVGVMLYFMLCGQLPFTAENPIAIAYKHVNEAYEPLSNLMEIDPFLEKIINKALEKDPINRFKNAKEFINNLELIYGTDEKKIGDTITSKAISPNKTNFISKKIFIYISSFLIIIFSIFLLKILQQPKGEHKITKINVTGSSNDTKKINNTYFAKNVIDGKRSTAWEEGVEGSGIGEYLLFTFKEPKLITKIGVIPGYDKVVDDKYGDRWVKNNRIKSATLIFSDMSDTTLIFRDSRELQFTHLNKITRYIKFIISDVYKGDEWDDTAISEVEIWGMNIN